MLVWPSFESEWAVWEHREPYVESVQIGITARSVPENPNRSCEEFPCLQLELQQITWS